MLIERAEGFEGLQPWNYSQLQDVAQAHGPVVPVKNIVMLNRREIYIQPSMKN
jgi:hypothetical protein